MKTILLLLCFLFVGILNAQTHFDQRLLVKYSQDELERINASNPNYIDYLSYYLDYSYTIGLINELPQGISLNLLYEIDYNTKTVSTVLFKDDEISNFNIFKYYFNIQKETMYFQLGNTGKYLKVLPEYVVINAYNKSIQN